MPSPSFERRAPPSDLAAGPLRHRRSRPQRVRVHRSARVGRPAAVAGAAARADRLRRLAVPVLFRVCRQSAADQPRRADRGRPAHRRPRRRGDPRAFAAGQRRLPGRDRPSAGALAARARSLRRGGASADARSFRPLLQRAGGLAGRLRAVHGRQGRARQHWRGRRGSPTSRSAIRRRSRGGRPAARARSGCTS